MLVPRTGPGQGAIMRYEALLTFQFSVTELPEETVMALAVNDEIVGADPCGTFPDV